MKRKLEPYIMDAGVVASGGDALLLSTSSVPQCKLFTALSIAVMDLDHSIDQSVTVGVLDGSKSIPTKAQTGSFPARTSMNTDYPIKLLPGQKLYALIKYPQPKDRISLYAHGYLQDVNCCEKRYHACY